MAAAPFDFLVVQAAFVGRNLDKCIPLRFSECFLSYIEVSPHPTHSGAIALT